MKLGAQGAPQGWAHLTRSHLVSKHCIFKPLNPFLSKCFGDRILIARPSCPYAGPPIILLGSKIVTVIFGLTTHHLAFLAGLYIQKVFFLLENDIYIYPTKGMACCNSWNFATDTGYPCDVYHFDCRMCCFCCDVILHLKKI